MHPQLTMYATLIVARYAIGWFSETEATYYFVPIYFYFVMSLKRLHACILCTFDVMYAPFSKKYFVMAVS
jgi:hypothetical protein